MNQNAKMSLIFPIIATGLFVCIYCESHIDRNDEINSRHRSIESIQSQQRQSWKKSWSDFLSDEESSITSTSSIEKSQRSKLRHRKVSDSTINNSGHKKHSIRQRGQRHRNNKNEFHGLADMGLMSDADNKLDIDDGVNDVGLWPPVFNVAPKAMLHANATCGQHTREEYCHTIDAHPQRHRKAKCGVCDAHDTERIHPIEYVIDGTQKWWQSPTLNVGPENEYITITMDLKQIYQVIFVSLKSAISPRPASWILERSVDGIDFMPWQYFGASDADCRDRYNLPGQNEPYAFQYDSEAICSIQFAKAIPLENGEVHLKLLEGRPGTTKNLTSNKDLMEFTLARFIRIRLQGMHTTKNAANNIQWLVDHSELNKRSFYSLKYIKIGARLNCNGHALSAKQYNGDEIIECDCAHNTCGVNCEKCCPLYNQRPFNTGTINSNNRCEKCECYGHSNECYYNPEVDQRSLSLNTDGVYSGGGVCLNCTDLTTGINCEKCIANYYRPHDVLPNAQDPCVPCECNPNGSVGVCNNIGGTCTCRTGFAGQFCEQCAAGYNGENCEKCACNAKGTMPGGECESHCQCKLYAEGQNCDKCSSGYFGLSDNNPEGCLKCYCSGVSATCESSSIISNTYETMDDWKVTDISRSTVMHPSRDNDTGHLVFNMYEMFDSQSIYWLAPDLYISNKLQSYGSILIFSISRVIARGDTSGKPTFGPTIILIAENGMRIAYGDEIFTETDLTMSIRLLEHGWYHLPPHLTEPISYGQRIDYHREHVTRAQFLSILSGIECVLLRGTFHTDQVESILLNAIIKSSRSNEHQIGSNLVEQCKCPIGYTGLSCETCDFGYVRAYENVTASERLGICLPCSCHGHAETCDLNGGKCGQCKHNTIGERCDECAPGYYGNAKTGTSYDCKRCACPLLNDTNNFSPTCKLIDSTIDQQNEVTSDYSMIPFQNSDYICTQCPEGYVGDHCESCTDGFYGTPMKVNSKCTRCPCNGGPCDPITGKCIMCQGNTEGWRCERCKAGYFGNPAKGCEPCRCETIGALNNICDGESGQCVCKPNYAGHQCDECGFGYANISLGCGSCECNQNGSIGAFCETHTGQCPCKIGIDGLKCDLCSDEFYGLSADGCQECHCSPHGSVTQTCHKHTGQCTCRANVIGRICDRCADGFWQLESGVGCHSCACNAIGSQAHTCDTYTGQCSCKQGVGGTACDSCLDGFYAFLANGCKRCEPCSNPAYNCDPNTGRCICPPNSKGIECNQCMANSYDWQHKKGCKLCDCDHSGSIGQSCDLYAGQCMCREGFTGRRCDQCARGYFNFPRCERCNCNRAGSMQTNASETIPCNDDGQCACKSLVTGLKCDECVPTTFGLSPANIDGCTRCFCFGRTNECMQSALSWGLIRAGDERHLNIEYQNMEFVAIQTANNELAASYDGVMMHTVNMLTVIPNTKGNISIGSLHGFEVPLYFELPEQFLGDHILSFAGYFTYGIEMKECKTELDRSIIEKFPLIQIHSHGSIILEYFGPEVYNINPNTTYRVRFTEIGWRFKSTGEWVSRELFMMSLQNITRVFIRATTSVAFTSLKLHNVTLERAIFLSGSTNNLAIGIEQCQCPSMYNGTSCQNPANGYYRYRTDAVWNENEKIGIERFVGQALACECNGRSNRCDIETGYCEMCSNNSGGEHCEKCAEGFYGNLNDIGCESCPCPETRRNFAKGCSFTHGRVSCLCKPGYVGDFCDECADGFYGNPESEEGACSNCECNPFGSVSSECDSLTGNCRCKEGVGGQRCDQCASPKSIIQNGQCETCDNCTITLLDSAEYLVYLIDSETDLIELDGIPAPWPRLKSLENSTQYLTHRLNNLHAARDKIESFSDLQIEKLKSKAQNSEIRWKKLQTKANKRSEASNMLDIDALLIFAELKTIQNCSQIIVDQLNAFGVESHHVNVSIAVRESQDLLQDIQNIAHEQNGAYRANQCATAVLEQWSNTSMILQAQLEESNQLKYDTLNVKNRLYDLIQNVYKTSETLVNVNGIHANNRHAYDRVNRLLSDITSLRWSINDVFNSSIIPQTDTVLNMIGDSHGKITQDLSNIIQLTSIVKETNQQCALKLNAIELEWLPKAREHSARLTERAQEYVQMFQDTKNSAKIAMMASTAYKNISDAIIAAQSYVNDAKLWAVESKNDMYPSHGDSILEKSLKSLNRSRKIHRNAMKDNSKLEDLEFLLKSQTRKVDAINNTMWQTGLRNNDIVLRLNTFSKNNIENSLKQAINSAKNYSEQMREVRRGAVAVMSSDVYKLKLKLASLEPQWAVKFGMAEENVSQSLHNIKDIKNTLTSIEASSNRSHEKFQKWNQSMSVLMHDLRDKIAKARHIAEGIRVSMESKGLKCARSYVPPTFGLSTANTIKLSIALNSKATTSPILYLQGEENRFLAIEMVKRKIRFAWNLGGNTATVTHSMELYKKDLEFDEAWYQIEANRTMNVGSLIVRHLGVHANRSVPMLSAASQPEFTRIVVVPTNKLWIGRIPDETYPSDSGLLRDNELSVVVSNVLVDGKPIGLWNFVNNEGACDGAMYGATDIRASNVRHFNGEGYSAVRKERFRPYKKNFFSLQMSFKTLDENALLFLAVDEKNNRSISLTLHGGRIVFRIDYGGESKLEINTTKKYNTGQWTSVEAAREFTSKRSTEIGSLKVGSEGPTIGSPTTPITSNSLPDLAKVVYYLGGIPPDFKSSITIAPGAEYAYLGCMKDIQINGETYDPLETSVRHGVESTCKETITRAGFNGDGYMELPNQSLRKRANIGFVFKTLQPDALLILAVIPQHELDKNDYDEKDIRSNYSIALTNGRLHFWVDSGRDRIDMVSNNTLNDGEYHTVNIIKTNRKFELRIDDEFQVSKSLVSQPFSINMIEGGGGLFVGGIPMVTEYTRLTEKLRSLRGTIKDVVINNQTISFTNTINHTHVEIGRSGPAMGNQRHASELLMKTEPISKSFTPVTEGCHRAGAYSYETNAFKFGDRPQSHSILNVGRHFWQNNFDIQFDFRTFYPNGLLFLIPGTKDKPKHFFTLNLRNGQLNVIARGRKRIETIMSPKLNDGQWQRISLKYHNKQLTVRIESDGESGQLSEEIIKMPRRISTSNMLYVGGVIDNMQSLSFELTSKLEQFKGCIRRFYVNNVSQDLAKPGRHSGINQCFPNVEKGSYFGGDAFAVYKRSFQVGKYLELRFEFRTAEVNGIILSIAEPVGFPAISIELHKGKISMSCDLGDGLPFRVESNLSSKFALCDNRWHNVSAFYDANQIAIRVDDLPSVNQFHPHEMNGKVHTKSPLYIGGLPETATSGTLLSRENFKGCIRNVVIRNELKDWTDMDELQNVLLSECIVMS